jgi:AcrR family transcriptional regulator
MSSKSISKNLRPDPLSRGKILEAALKLADSQGVEALSMRKLAQQLGVQAMSLYNHVSNKEDILDGLVEQVIGEIELPSLGAPWKEAMQARARSAHEVFLQHPWSLSVITSRQAAGPAMLAYVNTTLGILMEAGFSPAMADKIWTAMDSYIYGFTLRELNFPFEPANHSELASDYLEDFPIDEYPYFVRLASEIAEGQHSGVNELEFGLNLILEGLTAKQP